MGNTSVKLKETQAEFKANQAEGKKIKDRFERIKKERFDMFMDCFDFVSNEIDTVFKVRSSGETLSFICLYLREIF